MTIQQKPLTKREKWKRNIQTFLSTMKIMDTRQAGRFYNGAFPQKRASEILKELEKEKIIEGYSRAIGQTKLWRLTKKGRELNNVSWRPKPFNTREIEHILGVGNIMLDLWFAGGLQVFRSELREEYGRDKKFCPDAFFGFRRKAYLLEYQPSPLTSKRWEEKWKVYEEYFHNEHFLKASWQRNGSKIFPQIIVISSQQHSTIKQTDLPIRIMKDIKKVIE